RAARKLVYRALLTLFLTAAGGTLSLPVLAAVLPGPLDVVAAASLATALGAPLLWYVAVRPLCSSLPERGRAEQVIPHAADAILTIDRKGGLLALNPAGEQLFGYKTREVLGQTMKTLVVEPPPRQRVNLMRDSVPVGTVLGLSAGARELLG